MTLQNFTLGTFSQGAAGGGAAFESIASASGTGSSATITFSSIPSTYRHLQLRILSKYASTGFIAEPLYLLFNSDTTSGNYYAHHLQGNGSAAAAGSTAGSLSGMEIGWTPDSSTSPVLTNIFGVQIIDIHDYASTTKNKTVRGFCGMDYNAASTDARVRLTSGLWMSTSAVNSITITTPRSNWTTTSQFALYGIKGA